jgi:flagellar biosynthesis/type III secretory pathway protein FliH
LLPEEVVMESWIYKKGKQEGLEQGLEKGLEQGLEQGLEKGLGPLAHCWSAASPAR